MPISYQEILVIICVIIVSAIICVQLLPLMFSSKPGELGYLNWMKENLDTMFIKLSEKRLSQILWFSTIGIGLLLGGLFSLFHPYFGMFMFLVGLLLGRMAPKWTVMILRKRRIKKFNFQMVDALTLLSNALKSGLSVPQGLELVVKEMPNPIGQEFNLILSEQRVGLSMEEAFINLSKRIPVEDVDMFSTSIVILRETGGNLAETFDTIVHTIRERIKIQMKISALVSQGVMQGAIIFIMPFALGIAFYIIDPNHIRPMYTTVIGVIFLSVMLILQLFGGLIMWKIVNIEV